MDVALRPGPGAYGLGAAGHGGTGEDPSGGAVEGRRDGQAPAQASGDVLTVMPARRNEWGRPQAMIAIIVSEAWKIDRQGYITIYFRDFSNTALARRARKKSFALVTLASSCARILAT